MARFFGMLNHDEIARRRKALFTMEEAADRLGKILKASGHKTKVNRQRWYEIESGRHKDIMLSTAEAVAEVLNCGVDDLLTTRKAARS